LAGVVFAAVGVAAVYHQAGADSGFGQLGNGVSDVFRAVVRLFAADVKAPLVMKRVFILFPPCLRATIP